MKCHRFGVQKKHWHGGQCLHAPSSSGRQSRSAPLSCRREKHTRTRALCQNGCAARAPTQAALSTLAKEASMKTYSYPRDQFMAFLQEAADNGEVIQLTYYGGTHPGDTRPVAPTTVYKTRFRGLCIQTGIEKIYLYEKCYFPQLSGEGMRTFFWTKSRFRHCLRGAAPLPYGHSPRLSPPRRLGRLHQGGFQPPWRHLHSQGFLREGNLSRTFAAYPRRYASAVFHGSLTSSPHGVFISYR